MRKYLSIFKISFQQEFAYKLNFIMWRVRNIMNILLIFFMWSTVFYSNDVNLFGYDRNKILTYVFGILMLRALVLSARAVEISGEISRGDILNYLVKPINYFKYWLTRDLSSKSLNLIFAIIEFIILYLILKPPFYFQTNPLIIFLFIISVVLAILIFFSILLLVNMVPFWAPNMGWGAQFLVIVVLVEFLSGAVFPIDILPSVIQKILYFTPFPYLIFVPIQTYLGKLTVIAMLKSIGISLLWAIALWKIMNFTWKKGLKAYDAVGR